MVAVVTMELRAADHTAGGRSLTCCCVHIVGNAFMSYLVSRTEWDGAQIALQKEQFVPILTANS